MLNDKIADLELQRIKMEEGMDRRLESQMKAMESIQGMLQD